MDNSQDMQHERAGRIETVKGTVGDMVGTVKSAVTGTPAAARRAAGMAAENPLGLALGALALGFLAGLAVPISDMERERMGPLRQKLVDQAQLAGSDLLDAGKAVLQETAQAAAASAQQHGQDVVDAAKARAF